MLDQNCCTQYPLVLVHGVGFRDLKWPVYWGRIPKALEQEGACISYGLQDSWGSVETNAQALAERIDEPLSDINLSTANFVLNRIEGENDGLVSVASASWGDRVHILRSNAFRGLSHLDAIDLRRRPLTKKIGGGVSDICEAYLNIVRDLKERGL